ncbi:hypothetical protein EXIGLDRAFT_741174 [Exidia glandulosa HHB12029]|uniref:HD/PDEase domain-containing protein n=1 Tax=Exidia glandulosa HHB12029 TaxID=1314781 RepID=A0A165F425_EXIGL|nr:hypothetical protein EXIGLDRAFT_741174 [Exidia glandulosa HHB12029]
MTISSVYPTERERVAVDAAEKLMREAMAHNDPSHDPLHVLRVRHTAMKLARGIPSVDLFVVELAALLHDILDKKYVPEGTDARAHFAPFFAQFSDVLSAERAELVLRVVEHVSWTTEKKLRAAGQWGAWHDKCLELHCVQDADRLDAIGAIGVLRCAAYSSRIDRPLYVPPVLGDAEDSAIGHFHVKLVHIRDQLKTAEGKRLGEQRHNFLLQFLEHVDQECN